MWSYKRDVACLQKDVKLLETRVSGLRQQSFVGSVCICGKKKRINSFFHLAWHLSNCCGQIAHECACVVWTVFTTAEVKYGFPLLMQQDHLRAPAVGVLNIDITTSHVWCYLFKDKPDSQDGGVSVFVFCAN